MRESETRTGARRRPDGSDVALAVWIGLLGAGFVDQRALYVALLYAVPYLLLPAVRRMRGGAPVATGRDTRRIALTMLALSIAAAAIGAVTGAGTTWWWTVGTLALAAVALTIASRRSTTR
jgi:hypothetical protein